VFTNTLLLSEVKARNPFQTGTVGDDMANSRVGHMVS